MSLIIRASSPPAEKRVRQAWNHLEPRLPVEVRDFLTRTVMVHAVDVLSHQAFVIGAGPEPPRVTPLAELVLERQVQTGSVRTDDPSFLVVMSLGHQSPLRILAHELAHCWRRDPLAEGELTPERENEVELETEKLAMEWLARDPWQA